MRYEADVYWSRGTSHTVNQDSVVLIQALTSQGRVLMAAICDGMGGMDAGEVASGYLAQELVTWFYDGLLDAVGRKKKLWLIRRCAERKLYQTQRRLELYADKRGLRLGSTLSMLILWERRYLIFHLGDSRIYRFGGGVRSGGRLMTKDHADTEGRLYKCVGSFGYFAPDSAVGSVKRKEAFLICSDGFWKRMETEELKDALEPEGMEEGKIRRRLSEVGKAAVRRGEKDDLSAVYIKID